jgi:hypothetical protein
MSSNVTFLIKIIEMKKNITLDWQTINSLLEILTKEFD